MEPYAFEKDDIFNLGKRERDSMPEEYKSKPEFYESENKDDREHKRVSSESKIEILKSVSLQEKQLTRGVVDRENAKMKKKVPDDEEISDLTENASTTAHSIQEDTEEEKKAQKAKDKPAEQTEKKEKEETDKKEPSKYYKFINK